MAVAWCKNKFAKQGVAVGLLLQCIEVSSPIYTIGILQTVGERISFSKVAVNAYIVRFNSVALERKVTVIDSEELLRAYPDKTSKEREYEVAKKYGTVLIIGIGAPLSNGKPHDSRAPDYDDWSLNGDIIFYNKVLDCPFEISSMGIRVDEESLDRQLTLSGCDDRRDLPFHKMLLSGELPLTIGGGIGQSRLCMLMMGSAHIGEVQSSIWDHDTLDGCRKAGIRLL